MIVRIVKMQFQSIYVDQFIALFRGVQDKIRSQQGCLYLELLQQEDGEGVFFTYSHWEDQEVLDKYRQSSLFRETWDVTKSLFSQPAQAWSTKRLHQLP